MAKVVAINTPSPYRECTGKVLYFKCVNEEGIEIKHSENLFNYLYHEFEKDYPQFWVDTALYDLCNDRTGNPIKGIHEPEAYFAILTNSRDPNAIITNFPTQAFLDRVNAFLV